METILAFNAYIYVSINLNKMEHRYSTIYPCVF